MYYAPLGLQCQPKNISFIWEGKRSFIYGSTNLSKPEARLQPCLRLVWSFVSLFFFCPFRLSAKAGGGVWECNAVRKFRVLNNDLLLPPVFCVRAFHPFTKIMRVSRKDRSPGTTLEMSGLLSYSSKYRVHSITAMKKRKEHQYYKSWWLSPTDHRSCTANDIQPAILSQSAFDGLYGQLSHDWNCCKWNQASVSDSEEKVFSYAGL